MNSRNLIILDLFITFLIGISFAYDWPVGQYVGTQHLITSTFMEYRPATYHDGVDMVPTDGHQTVYSVAGGIVSIGGSGYDEWIRVGNYAYVHVDVDPNWNNGDYVPGPYYDLGDIYQGSNPHLHFKDGPVNNLSNPLRCNALSPYDDFDAPTVLSVSLVENGTSNPIQYYDVYGLVDIIVECYDETWNYFCSYTTCPGLYRIGYQLQTQTGQAVFNPIYNIQFDTWTTDNNADLIWDSDNHLIVTNELNSNGVASDNFWNSQLIRNGDYRIHIIAEDLNSCNSRNQTTFDEYIYIDNNPQEIYSDITQTAEWFGEYEVWGYWNGNRYVAHVTGGNALTFDEWSRIRIKYDTWLIIDPGATLNIETGAEVILEPGAEIINQNGASIVLASDIEFESEASCLNNMGQLTISENVSLDVDNGFIAVNSGELILEDNAQLIFADSSQSFGISPGSTIKLGHKARIQVNSKLEVEGSAAEEPIIFTSLYENPTPQQYWSWLKIVGEGEDDPSVLKYATVEYADYGLYAYNANVIIENNIIQNNRYFNLYLDNCDADITNNAIQNADVYDGIFVTGSSPELYGNFISGNGGIATIIVHPNSDLT